MKPVAIIAAGAVSARGLGADACAVGSVGEPARTVIALDPEKRSVLKRAGFLTRDARKKERKKYGQPGARKRFQYSKR